jgi:predicted HTH transcriptional regulator
VAVLWSRIHAELGLAPTELTYDMVIRAVVQRVLESDDLDWKQALPVDVEKKLWEFAKDVAAMANTRGGLIVYGVRDEDERAVELVGVPTGERERQRLRALANRYIRPLVAGLEIGALTSDDGEKGIIVVSVPASPDAPHIVGERNEMGVPFRHGAHTEWMSEHQIERAYRDRFAGQAGEATAVTTLVDEVAQHLDFDKGVWLVMAAHPLTPLPTLIEPPPREQVATTLNEALRLGAQIYPTTALYVPPCSKNWTAAR